MDADIGRFRTRIGQVELASPLVAASGTWAYGLELLDSPANWAMGAFVTKSLSCRPSVGNPMPRLYETEAGLLNSIGLQNMGIDPFLRDVEPKLKAAKVNYILSIYGNRVEDFEELAEKANSSSALAVELNISCPNIDNGGLEFSSDPQTTQNLVSQVRKRIRKPLWVKLSPNVTRIEEIAKAAEAAGAEALSLINTLLGMAIDVYSREPWLGKKRGGLSGPAIKPVAIERIYRCYSEVKIPLIGMGGIRNARDVVEFLLAGASAVQIGTWNFRDPYVYPQILKELQDYLDSYGFKKFSDLVGLAHRSS